MCSDIATHVPTLSPSDELFRYLGPRQLKRSVREEPIECFLCGPGQEAGNHDIRGSVRRAISLCDVTVRYGEELPNLAGTRKASKSKLDLQTMESDYAKRVDLTILLLDSPGAIAELGSFCMMPAIRCHLYVLVPERYHGHESYIARGPLDLLARFHSLSVSYFSPDSPSSVPVGIWYPIMLHKYARNTSQAYRKCLRRRSRSRRQKDNDRLEDTMTALRHKFLIGYVASTIAVLGSPTFAALAAFTRIAPEELRSPLRSLYNAKVIKNESGRYEFTGWLKPESLSPFDGDEISKMRCRRLARN